MARKRKKESPIEIISQAVLLGSFTLGWYMTNSWKVGLYFAVIAIVLMVAVAFFIKQKRKERLRKSGISEIDSMDGVQFEHYLKLLFESKGYTVKTTATTGDFGADLLLKKDGVRTVVQAKRYSKSVGVKAVQEVIPAMKMYDATEAWVVSNSSYTKAAKELANTHNVRLLGREELIDMINELGAARKPDPLAVKKEIPQENRKKCEQCGSPLIIRNGKRGIFYGCSTFPKCKYTADAT